MSVAAVSSPRAVPAAVALWIVSAAIAAGIAAWRLDAAVPVFTFVWLAVALGSLLRHREPARVGIRRVAPDLFVRTTLAVGAAQLAVAAAVEPWSGTYGRLVDAALDADPADTTFGWLARFDGAGAWTGLVLFSGLVTIFAEELFFRGWLLQLLLRHTGPAAAIAGQAAGFTLVQGLAATALAPLQAGLYVAVYSFVAIGLLGGYAAWRTASIWPSLVLATALNASLVALLA